jgi:ATPase subunit of ABC transporter with duplicated ATPase domains
MLINIDIKEKSIGNKILYEDLAFSINDNEKVGFIGRNGTGKTSLFKIIEGVDKDFSGTVDLKKNINIIITKQEYLNEEDITVIDYILNNIPRFIELKNIIDTYPETMGNDMDKIQIYTDAITDFSELGYYSIEDKIKNSLSSYKIDKEKYLMPLINLSGGEKRFVELVKVMYSNCDIALIDEPTNHMDDIGKTDFISWFKDTKHSIFVITHDRDVLNYVDKIIEIKDKKAFSFIGNYDAYLKQNSLQNITNIKTYEEAIKSGAYLKKQIQSIKKRGAHASTRVMYERVEREYKKIESSLEKPSIWIDKESIENSNQKVIDKYEKYKDKNIKLQNTTSKEEKRILIEVKNLSIGYSERLFSNINFSLSHGDRIRIKGKNGAGKTSLIKTIISTIFEEKPVAQIYEGEIKFNPKVVLGIYEQEIDLKYMKMTLSDAISNIYNEKKIEIPNINKILKDYLFNPSQDRDLPIEYLSGGQKARFQIIKMLLENPNVLILDEPTNHLDLPSIEELEASLLEFNGAILYVSHDSYFVKKIMGETIEIK